MKLRSDALANHAASDMEESLHSEPGEPMKVVIPASRVDTWTMNAEQWLDSPVDQVDSAAQLASEANAIAGLVHPSLDDDPSADYWTSPNCAPWASKCWTAGPLPPQMTGEFTGVSDPGFGEGWSDQWSLLDTQHELQSAALYQHFLQAQYDVCAADNPLWTSQQWASGVSSGELAEEAAMTEGMEEDQMTTVIVKNIPGSCDRAAFLRALDTHGFKGLYDFVYLRIALDKGNKPKPASFRYAFVNFVDHTHALHFKERFDGLDPWTKDTAGCQVSWSKGIQGLEAHVERYRSSPVMYREVPDDCKPMIFKDGRRVQFPRPQCRSGGKGALA